MVKPFLSKSTISRVQFLSYDERIWKPVLLEYVPEEVLPEEFGGTAESLWTLHARVEDNVLILT